MALPDLATSADLSARGYEPDDDDVAAVMLAVASALVRQAAGSPISETESVVTVWAVDEDRWLDLPGQPIQSVTSLTINGEAVTDFLLVNGRLYRLRGWLGAWCNTFPSSTTQGLGQVAVTMTHGLPTVPADIVQLVCDLAILGTNTAASGAVDPRVVAEKIDDYSVTFSQAAASVASAMTLPPLTRTALKARFGGGVALVGRA